MTGPGNGYSLSSIHTGIFSGGTFSSIPDDQPKDRNISGNVRLPSSQVFVPPHQVNSLSTPPRRAAPSVARPTLVETPGTRPSGSSDGRCEVQDVRMYFNGNGQGQVPGMFPADLETYMDTDPSAFEVDVNEVLNHELKVEGNLDFSFDQLGAFLGLNGSAESNNQYGSVSATALSGIQIPTANLADGTSPKPQQPVRSIYSHSSPQVWSTN